MPLIGKARASKACLQCRKNKTRCYASGEPSGVCLRCATLSLACSLKTEGSRKHTPAVHQNDHGSGSRGVILPDSTQQHASVDTRLDRLEGLVERLVNRLETTIDSSASGTKDRPPRQIDDGSDMASFSRRRDSHPAPVFLIRDACAYAGVSPPGHVDSGLSRPPDAISMGIVSLGTAHTLLKIFRTHYGRWVKFSESLSTEALLLQARRSPLLVCSIFLIAVRHTTEQLADKLAPRLFDEAKSLLSSALLIVPQPMEFYQAAIILGLWSTTIGQVPLSIDNWMLTGYALQQALASPFFIEAFRCSPSVPVTKAHRDAWCLWNHLTLAHLQQAMLNQSQIDRCLRFVKADDVDNYETRMVAEVQLHWIIYQKCCAQDVDFPETSRALQAWQRKWNSLFNQPRSQFLHMGFHFAHLFAYYQSLKSPQMMMDSTILSEMIHLSRTIINLAIDTADERTRHLTDHIYHIVTFSALTSCQLLHNYASELEAIDYDIYALDSLIYTLINWFDSIGPRCDAAHLLGHIVSVQFQKLRPGFRPAESSLPYDMIGPEEAPPIFEETSQPNMGFTYPNMMGLDLFAISDDTMPWPQCV
ncbi:hypothetical protein C2857_000214 [Epichloe festucae Fl1]|uniref:Transcriptional activator of proteases prtT n=1 Tax=Epichloe festucae (strain Fl1) TaxID=877507 RepID=A0A7S9KTY9_EPIFF|nr:hypothetical protein C2857_000214 [Epichloe festucae Fl1]